METAEDRADLGISLVTQFVLIGLGILIAVLTVVAVLDLLPPLRIVPDDTHFDFTRFRRISFPISAALSILAIVLFFTHGLNFGIDFRGGTLLEVQNKAGPADIGAMRATLSTLGLGDIQLQQFGGPNDVLIRVAEQPGGDAAQQAAVTEGPRRARRFRGLSQGRSGRPARLRRIAGLWHARPDARDFLDPDLSLVPVRMAVRAWAP